MSYWGEREGLEYYATVQRILDAMGPQESILDVGCLDTPVVTWGQFRRRYTVDPENRPPLSGVWPIIGRWPDCRVWLPLPVSVVLCLQVLEHVDDPHGFAQWLFAAADTAVILSVPWGWPAGVTPGHIHDPVDAAVLYGWTGRRPDELHAIVTPARAVAVYRVHPQPSTTPPPDCRGAV